MRPAGPRWVSTPRSSSAPNPGWRATFSLVADHTMPPWRAGDEVYGRAGELREFLEDNEIGYVLRVGSAFHATVAPGAKARADDLVARYTVPESWQICSVASSKGGRAYAWTWISTTRPRHFLLVRKHLATGELAYHYWYLPPDRPVQMMTLVRVACLRWPVEEDFEFGKDHFGLDHSQVRLYPALLRHIVLTMAALAVCAVTAAQAKTHTPAPILPTTPDSNHHKTPDLIALTVAETKRLFMLVTRELLPETHHLHWTWWRRRHQARLAGSTTEPDSADKPDQHDETKVRLLLVSCAGSPRDIFV
jgi:Transposase DDE domain